MDLIRTDCRHYELDRPCKPHKKEGVHCEGCPYYDCINSRVLLIKLGAMGDVLRTTALLGNIRAMEPGCQITWIAQGRSLDVLQGLEVIDRLWPLDESTAALLSVEQFDWVINLDLSAESLALASLARGKRKSGFGLTEQGVVKCWNPEARPYLAMSYWDDIKKQNRKTYQQLMLDIIGSREPAGEILVHVPEEEKEYARKFAEEQGIDSGRPTVGLNIGAAGRWRWKRWTSEGFLQLARALRERHQANLMVLSGPDEAEYKAEWIAKCAFPVIDAGHNNTYARFAALVDLCDVVVTGDTMPLHLALALGKHVVALFGPTSRDEVELYGRGQALSGDVPCLCCYMPDCDVRPTCMEVLSSEDVLNAVESQLEESGKKRE